MVTRGSDAERSQRSPSGSFTGLTGRLCFVIFWTVLSTFNFGFGTSELNPLQNILSCPPSASPTSSTSLPSCISLTNPEFGYITAAFTVGGFLASLTLSPLKDTFTILKRSRNTVLMAAAWNILGGVVQMMAASWRVMALGRFIMGLGSGVAVAVVPAYLNDISPPHLRGSIGVTNQLSIVFGILTAQALGVSPLGSASTMTGRGLESAMAPWRYVPLVSSGFAALQILLLPFTLDAPSDVEGEEKDKVQRKLWGASHNYSGTGTADESEALLSESEPYADTGSEITSLAESPSRALTISELLLAATRPNKASSTLQLSSKQLADIRKGTLLIIFTQMAQQLSGVNAVFYFSTGILSDLFRSGESEGGSDRVAQQICLGVTFVNVLMTFPPIPLIREDLLGRKRLLQLSSLSMALSALALSAALLTSQSILAAISIVVFVAGFSLGLGPIPFLILPELVPKQAVSAASSLGLSLNWLSNISVASLFLPLKDSLAHIDGSNGGSIFLIFVVINLVSFIGVTRYYTCRSHQQT